jgi:hypothetical protein
MGQFWMIRKSADRLIPGRLLSPFRLIWPDFRVEGHFIRD